MYARMGLQVTFAHLALSSLNFYVPRHFWRAFKDYDGEPVNLREHQDAFEFLTRLQDLVDQNLSDARQDKVMKNIMGGKFAQQVRPTYVLPPARVQLEFFLTDMHDFVRGLQTVDSECRVSAP
jgi:hypothetical protein